MTLSLTVLGSSGMFATTERAASGYLLETAEIKLLLDCGGGTWRNLLTHVSDYGSITGVILTHRHPDHVIDVFQLFHARHYGQLEKMEEIPLWAPAETLERVSGFGKEIDQSFAMKAISPGDIIRHGGVSFRFHEMAHPPDTLGVRIEGGGAVIAYSADTGPTGDIGALADGADVFICEATLQDSDEEWEGHMTATQAGAAAAAASAKKLVLTHLPPGRDAGLSLTQAHKTSGEAQVQLASDGLRLEVSG
ncbi:MAG TPA: MBL fold metallo-hydrolase [Actinomycetota bacterium]|nr:MBL fold metallo-hydrolase [Actinomycetota bacterium]